MEHSWDKLTTSQKILDVVLFLILASFFAIPFSINALNQDGDKKCTPEFDYTCPFNTPKEKCPKKQKPGGLGKPCDDETNGNTIPGKCTGEMKCKGEIPGGDSKGEQQKEQPKDSGGGKMPEMPKLPEPPKEEPPPPSTQPPCKAMPIPPAPVLLSTTTIGSDAGDLASLLKAANNTRGSGGTPCPGDSFLSNPFSFTTPDLSSGLLSLTSGDTEHDAILDFGGSSDQNDQSASGDTSAADASGDASQRTRSTSELSADIPERGSGGNVAGNIGYRFVGQQTFTSGDLGGDMSGNYGGRGGLINNFTNGVASTVTGFNEAMQAVVTSAADWVARVASLFNL